MAIKNYTFKYNLYEAEVSFKVDTEKFTEEMAKATLEFFTWDYDKSADPIDEVMKKYAITAIEIASSEDYNAYGIIHEFDDKEGFCRIDGSQGITLTWSEKYEFDEENLSMEVKIEK